MRCAYCNGPCDDRPVRYEAVCWDCHRKHQDERTNPFEAFGEAMQTVGCWLFAVCCKLLGHRWEASVYPEPHNDHIEAWYCKRCYKVEYPKASVYPRTTE